MDLGPVDQELGKGSERETRNEVQGGGTGRPSRQEHQRREGVSGAALSDIGTEMSLLGSRTSNVNFEPLCWYLGNRARCTELTD